jgi:two-component system NtrC family response regulator
MTKINKEKILIVDDDQSVISALSFLLKKNNYIPIAAYTPEQALQFMEEHKPALIIHDMNYSRQTSGAEGMELLANIRKANTEIPVILITAWGSIDLAVSGIKAGANDFVNKPWSNQRLLQVVATALDLRINSQNSYKKELNRQALDQKYQFSSIIGKDEKLLKILTTIGRIAATDASVLILGESGTGKELIANAIHQNSSRKQNAMVKVNLGGIPGSLFESEMFGHVKGAFTDAKSDRIGRFEMANNGTILLDEIGDMDKSSQVKLLRVLQDQTFQAVGSSANRRCNVRVVAATNCDIQQLITENKFREDLLYRLNLITITLPPLRERRGDIAEIAQHVLTQVCQRYDLKTVNLTEEAMQWLAKQNWPGNIRQLTQTLERAVLVNDNNKLDVQSFTDSEHISQTKTSTDDVPPLGSMTLEEMEQRMIKQSLTQYNNNLTQVASNLGLTRQALYRRMEKYGIIA